MNGETDRPSPASRLGSVAPLPLVGAAALLVALIVFTPVLLASGPSALAVQAVLKVDRVVGSPTTHFYLTSLGLDVRYQSLNLSVGTGFSWNGTCPPSSGVSWSFANEIDSLVLGVSTEATTVVVSATAVYAQGGSLTIFAAEIAFNVTHFGTSGEALAISPCPGTPGESPPSSWAVADLPLSLLLVNYGSGGPP